MPIPAHVGSWPAVSIKTPLSVHPGGAAARGRRAMALRFEALHPEGICPGWSIVVKGETSSSSSMFEINLLCDPGDQIALHFNPRFSSSRIVCNSFLNTHWGQEEVNNTFPFKAKEPFQVFTLPKVSAKTKFKLTAHEGCRVRKVALVSLASAGSEERLENCLACLTNLGDIHIFTVPSLRPQVHYSCIRKEDISGIASCVFTKHGQGFYLISPSEFERFSLSARNVTEPLCRLEVARLQDTSCLSNSSAVTPKLPQANGTHVPRSSKGQHSPSDSDRSPEEHPAAFSPSPIDSPNSSMENPLDTTGDITVEEVKDFLASSEEAERNLRNTSEDEARPTGILIK